MPDVSEYTDEDLIRIVRKNFYAPYGSLSFRHAFACIKELNRRGIPLPTAPSADAFGIYPPDPTLPTPRQSETSITSSSPATQFMVYLLIALIAVGFVMAGIAAWIYFLR